MVNHTVSAIGTPEYGAYWHLRSIIGTIILGA